MRILILLLGSLELISCQPINGAKPMPHGVEPNCDFTNKSVGHGIWVTKKECALNTLSPPFGFQELRMGEQNILEKGRCINPSEGDLNDPIIGQCYARQKEFRPQFRPSLTIEILLSKGFKYEDIPGANQMPIFKVDMPNAPSAPARISESSALPNGHPMSSSFAYSQDSHIDPGNFYIPHVGYEYYDNIHTSLTQLHQDLTLHSPLASMPGIYGTAAVHMPPHIYDGEPLHGANPHPTVQGDLTRTAYIVDDRYHTAETREDTMQSDYHCFIGPDGKSYFQRLQRDPETRYFYALSPQLIPVDLLGTVSTEKHRCIPGHIREDKEHLTYIEPINEAHKRVLGAGFPVQDVRRDATAVTEPGVVKANARHQFRKEPSMSFSGPGSKQQGVRKNRKPGSESSSGQISTQRQRRTMT